LSSFNLGSRNVRQLRSLVIFDKGFTVADVEVVTGHRANLRTETESVKPALLSE
jgi:hypothetical protein